MCLVQHAHGRAIRRTDENRRPGRFAWPRIVAVLTGAAVLSTAGAAFPAASAAELSGRDVIGRMQLARALGGDDAMKVVRLTTITPSGQSDDRTIVTYYKQCDDVSRNLLRFRDPPDVAGSAVLTWARADGSADMWLYLPEIGRVRQLNAAARGETFMGTDLTYEDLSGYHLDVRTHRLVGEEEMEGRATYKVESTPFASDVYARILTWVDRETLLPVRIKYWDRHGSHQKTARFSDVRVVEGIPTIFRVEVANVQSGHRSELVVLDVAYGAGIACDRLTRRHLARDG
jgi:hypothetical protein